MTYKHTFKINLDDKNFEIDAYALDFINDIPTQFQIFVNGNLEGFIYYKDKLQLDRYSFSKGILNETLLQQIADYLISLYS